MAPPHAISSSPDPSLWRGSNISSILASQWQNPSDALTVLLIIGGDIIQKALAQLSGGWIVPVAFSFGWVSYSLNTLLAVFGEGSLMPIPSSPSLLINAGSGYARLNYSWVLNRILLSVERQLEPLNAALCVSIFGTQGLKGRVPHDWLWWSGITTTIVQLIIASVPWAVEGDWTILLVTMAGAMLAFAGGCLPDWKKEKWHCRIDTRHRMYCLTRGNGFQHVVVILNQGAECLNLEDLAPGTRRTGCSRGCKRSVTLMATLWIALLVNVAGMRQNTWYLLGVGVIGMVQNIVAAAAPRHPTVMGLPLYHMARIKGPKAMGVLMDTESRFPGLGLALLGTFFPGELREHEQRFWSEAKLGKAETKSSSPHSIDA